MWNNLFQIMLNFAIVTNCWIYPWPRIIITPRMLTMGHTVNMFHFHGHSFHTGRVRAAWRAVICENVCISALIRSVSLVLYSAQMRIVVSECTGCSNIWLNPSDIAKYVSSQSIYLGIYFIRATHHDGTGMVYRCTMAYVIVSTYMLVWRRLGDLSPTGFT